MKQNYLKYLLILLLLQNKSYALRCGNAVIVLGDTPQTVKIACGKPTQIHSLRRGKSKAIQWTYDFGPHEFKEVLTFQKDKLVQMNTAGYGG